VKSVALYLFTLADTIMGNMIVIGLTGGIASGKSAVARILSDLGAKIIDADKVGHKALRAHDDTKQKLVDTFGKDIIGQDGEIDRSKLAEIVFNKPESLEKLNRIMHPVIRKMVEQEIKAMRDTAVEVTVLEAALLIEAGWTDLVNETWVALAQEATVMARLCSQRGLTEKQAKIRINSQMPIDKRAEYADVVIENDSDLETLRNRVEKLWNELTTTKPS